MRRGQSSIEAVIGATLLAALLGASALLGLHSWRAAELELAQVAAARAATRGGDPAAAAAAAVPPLLREAARAAATGTTR